MSSTAVRVRGIRSESDLITVLRVVFEEFGSISHHVFVPPVSPNSTGTALFYFENADSAKEAAVSVPELYLDGFLLTVSLATANSPQQQQQDQPYFKNGSLSSAPTPLPISRHPSNTQPWTAASTEASTVDKANLSAQNKSEQSTFTKQTATPTPPVDEIETLRSLLFDPSPASLSPSPQPPPPPAPTPVNLSASNGSRLTRSTSDGFPIVPISPSFTRTMSAGIIDNTPPPPVKKPEIEAAESSSRSNNSKEDKGQTLAQKYGDQLYQLIIAIEPNSATATKIMKMLLEMLEESELVHIMQQTNIFQLYVSTLATKTREKPIASTWSLRAPETPLPSSSTAPLPPRPVSQPTTKLEAPFQKLSVLDIAPVPASNFGHLIRPRNDSSSSVGRPRPPPPQSPLPSSSAALIVQPPPAAVAAAKAVQPATTAAAAVPIRPVPAPAKPIKAASQPSQVVPRFVVVESTELEVMESTQSHVFSATFGVNKIISVIVEDQAAIEASGVTAPVYMFVWGKGVNHACGLAKIMSAVHFDVRSGRLKVAPEKWCGEFNVSWLQVKDIASEVIDQAIRDSSVSPFAQWKSGMELPTAAGWSLLMLFCTYQAKSSLLEGYYHRKR